MIICRGIYQENIILRMSVMDFIKIILAVIIFLYLIYDIFRLRKHYKEVEMDLKENRLKTFLGKENRESKREIITFIILALITTVFSFLR
jgi:tellurite resistance protein TehA-like permease